MNLKKYERMKSSSAVDGKEIEDEWVRLKNRKQIKKQLKTQNNKKISNNK
jgi:hypothetical protein